MITIVYNRYDVMVIDSPVVIVIYNVNVRGNSNSNRQSSNSINNSNIQSQCWGNSNWHQVICSLIVGPVKRL